MCEQKARSSQYIPRHRWGFLAVGIVVGTVTMYGIGRFPLLVEANWADGRKHIKLDSRTVTEVCIAKLTG